MAHDEDLQELLCRLITAWSQDTNVRLVIVDTLFVYWDVLRFRRPPEYVVHVEEHGKTVSDFLLRNPGRRTKDLFSTPDTDFKTVIVYSPARSLL